MSPEYPTDYEPATPEYVLEVLRTTTPAGTRDYPVLDLLGWLNDLAWPTPRLLGDCMNAVFQAAIPTDEWRQEFPTLRGRTIGDVCDFIARHARRPVIRPWRYVAGECRPAGAFLTVRSLLAARGVRPREITPSTPLATVPLDDLMALFWTLARIAPGRLPPPVERRAFVGHYVLGSLAACWLLLGGILGPVILGLAASARAAVGVAVGVGMIVSAAGGGWLLWRVHRPAFLRAEWGEYRTFRDLAYALAGQEPRRRIQPTA